MITLIGRLRQVAEFFHIDYACMKRVSLEAADRIEKLEAALVDISQHVSMANWHQLKPETLATLESTDD